MDDAGQPDLADHEGKPHGPGRQGMALGRDGEHGQAGEQVPGADPLDRPGRIRAEANRPRPTRPARGRAASRSRPARSGRSPGRGRPRRRRRAGTLDGVPTIASARPECSRRLRRTASTPISAKATRAAAIQRPKNRTGRTEGSPSQRAWPTAQASARPPVPATVAAPNPRNAVSRAICERIATMSANALSRSCMSSSPRAASCFALQSTGGPRPPQANSPGDDTVFSQHRTAWSRPMPGEFYLRVVITRFRGGEHRGRAAP